MKTEIKHPEQKKNEIFLINIYDNELNSWKKNQPDFIKKLRRGKVAYKTNTREVVPDMRPLFGVQKIIEDYPRMKMKDTSMGFHFTRVCEEAQTLAKNKFRIIEFIFNGITCLVSPDTNLNLLYRDYCNADTMEWKEVGHKCVKTYSTEIRRELKRKKQEEAVKATENEKIWREEQNKKTDAFNKRVEGIEMEIVEKEKYEKWKAENKDPYGNTCFVYAEDWAKLMQKTFTDNGIEEPHVGSMLNYAENCGHEADVEGVTGLMYGMAVSILSKHWKYGEALRRWHNRKYGHKGSGVVNPAVITIQNKKEKK